MRVVLATGNTGKVREYERLLAEMPGLTLESMASLGISIDVVEDGDTFHANARKKAVAVAAATGLFSMADDSGLEVDALEGCPGVHSARYAGEGATDAQNVAKLLRELEGVPEHQRSARFRCVIVLVDARGDEIAVADGTCEGRIAESPRGSHGFGYDPLFIADEKTETMAELPPGTKNEISHRAKAAAKLVQTLRELQSR